MITVTGRTFEHRALIQRLRGVWDSGRKAWVIRSKLNAAEIETLRSKVGLIVTVYDDVRPSSGGMMNIYGDDPTYHNYFAPRNPMAFFGFSSLAKMVDYLEALPRSYAADPRRNGWESGNAAWIGTDSMTEALELARHGWPDGATAAEHVVQRLALSRPRVRRHKPSLAGGTVNVGRLLAGDPRHMVSRPKQPGSKIVTLFVEAGCSGLVTTGTLVRRAAVIGSISDIMENQGYSCTIVVVDTSIHNGRTYYQLAVTLKESGERLHLGDLMFALGHPAFLRRLSFAVCSSVPETIEIWSDQGSPSNAFTDDHACRKNEFYIPVIEKNTENVDQTISLVVPKNLPISLDNNDRRD